MIIECERCHKEVECRFHGYAADEDNLNQNNGEWLCEPCVPLRIEETKKAISALRKTLGKVEEDKSHDSW